MSILKIKKDRFWVGITMSILVFILLLVANYNYQNMLISTSTNAISEISYVTQETFNSFLPYIIMIVSIVITFFIIDMIVINTLQKNRGIDKDKREQYN